MRPSPDVGLLFMAMGAVLHMTGRSKGSELGGLYKSMPITTALCIVGAASISAFPLFAGFVSKAMNMSATLEQGHTLVWLALLFASAGAFAWLKLAKLYPPELASVNLDAEWVYRRAAPELISDMGAIYSKLDQSVRQSVRGALVTLLGTLSLHHGPKGALARTWPTGRMVLLVAALLGLYLMIY